MIKLIATDMDGSLLDDEKRLPPDFREVFEELRRRGIPLVIASGRSVVCLGDYLREMPGAPACICDNGAYVLEDGALADVREIPRENLHKLLRACETIPGIDLILSGIRGTYYQRGPSGYYKMVESYYSNHVLAEDFYQLDDVIFKVGLSDQAGPLTHSCPRLREAVGDLFALGVSGRHWIDITNRGVTKGSALNRLQKRLGVTPEETMAFGDNFNDIELLEAAHYSFAMKNALPEIHCHANYIAKSNLEYGVTDAIRRYVLEA